MIALERGINRSARWRLGWQCGFAALISVLSVAPALACTQPPGGVPHYTIAQHVKAAEVVLEGTITQVTQVNFGDSTALIDVQQYFKGSGPATVTISGFGTGADCRAYVRAGDTWIFFANGNPNTGLFANYLSEGDAIASPTPDTIAQIIAALQSKPRAFIPLAITRPSPALSAAPRQGNDGFLMGSALLAVVVGALSFQRLFRMALMGTLHCRKSLPC
jgi:hypothetical protein